MNKSELKGNVKEAYSSKEKRIMVEEIRSGMLSLRQSIQKHQVSGSVLQKWNRWYFKTRLPGVLSTKISISDGTIPNNR
ncbi:hypothetical protein AHMF7605_28550 [Adhaeribacter arboris]|uniref:Transposase n=1 Tax=Adhaeribacter arboris TaxID=2072846 RepID=A0A2T2Y8P3_9BACT|nr:hypothetical protein [Adhaeribacter arboris]PSR51866.1 hypothetical protein AHMF7605_28550 [Adhaeribacter arboris]